MRTFTILAAMLALAACDRAVRPTPPPPEAPTVLKLRERTYVPIDKALTKRCPWVRDGELVDMPAVARGRKTCLEKYEAQFDAIERAQGSPAGD